MSSEALERATKESRAKYVVGTPEEYPRAELRGFTILEAEALLAEVARLEQERDEAREAMATFQRTFKRNLRFGTEDLRADLAAARTREQQLVDGFAPLLAAAEAEVGPKTPGSKDKNAEYWAALDSDPEHNVPGVTRRIILARAVLAARAALAAEPAAAPDEGTAYQFAQRAGYLPRGSASAAADEPGESEFHRV